MEKYDKEKREDNKIPEKDDTSSSTQRENSKQSEPKDSDSDSDFDIEDERLTLIQVNNRIRNRKNEKKNTTFLNKTRSNPITNIAFDRATKTLCDPFIPTYEELNNFLKYCKVSEINADSSKDNDTEKDSPKNIFDPFEFMKKNNIDKSILSLEDDICAFPNKKEIDFNCEIKEELPKLSMPLMGPLLFSSTTPGNESLICSEKEDYAQIKKILNTDILDKSQKQWLSYFIDKVGKMQ
jgi:hypothetical protein